MCICIYIYIYRVPAIMSFTGCVFRRRSKSLQHLAGSLGSLVLTERQVPGYKTKGKTPIQTTNKRKKQVSNLQVHAVTKRLVTGVGVVV